MGKSSSSSKKLKHSTDSSTKLRSVKKNKKTKRNKPKKIRRITEDYSDESESSFSDSSLYTSSSEDDYKRKKKRRSKLSKKKSRKRYSSSESDDDDADDGDDSRPLKKKKRSKRKDESLGKKKKKKRLVSRKRRKRDLSSSSTSSEQSGSESDGKRRSRDRGTLGKVKAARSISRESEPDECWQLEDEVIPKNNSRRLKSIIVVSYGYGNDERKEEDDRDVYMTPGGNSELGHSEESDERDGETTISYARTRADENVRKTVGYDECGEYNKSEVSKVSHPDCSLKDDDLEAILKKRALENLKRFRGVTQKSGTARKEVSSVSEGEPLQIESEKVEESQDHGLLEQKLCDSAVSKDLETSENILHVVNVKESGTALANSVSQQDQQSGDTAKVKASSSISSCSTKRKLIRPLLGKESLNLASRKEAAGGQDAEAEIINGSTIDKSCPELSINGSSTIDKNCPESSLALAPKNGGENIELTKVSSSLNAQSSSHTDTVTLDDTEHKKTDETKDESQYEQKTMTVMRGGEMVQVSYKVYIPKTKSTLGRRKLNR